MPVGVAVLVPELLPDVELVGVDEDVDVPVLVDVLDGELVPVEVIEPVLVAVLVLELVPVLVADAVAEVDGVIVALAVADSDAVIDEVLVDVPDLVAVEVAEELGLAVVVEDALIVDVPVAVEVLEAVGVPVELADDVLVPVEDAVELDSTTVCVSVAIGRTIQLVPSEIARNIPPINLLAVVNPMLSAVKSLKITKPAAAPATIMAWSATLANRTTSPLLVEPADGSVNVTCDVAPRVVNTVPKSSGVNV